jgi:WD40 repeat protein
MSPDTRYLLISTDGVTKQTEILKLADILTGQVTLIYQGVYQGQSSSATPPAVFSNDNKYIAFVGVDWRIHIWDIAAGKIILTSDTMRLTRGLTSWNWMSWSADDKRILVENVLNARKNLITLQVWDAQTGHRLANIVGTPTMSLFFAPPDGFATLGDFSPDGTRILTYNQQAGTFEERETSTLKVLLTFHVRLIAAETGGCGLCIPYWQASGTRLFLLQDHKVTAWDALTGQLLSTIPFQGNIRPQALGRYLALNLKGNMIEIRDMATGAHVRTIAPVVDAYFMVWLPDSNYLDITDGRQSYGQIYNALTGKLIVSYQGDNYASLSPDLRYIAIPHDTHDPRSGDLIKSTIQVLPVSS